MDSSQISPFSKIDTLLLEIVKSLPKEEKIQTKAQELSEIEFE